MISVNRVPSEFINKEHFRILPRDLRYGEKQITNTSRQLLDDYYCKYCDYKISKFQILVDHLREEHL